MDIDAVIRILKKECKKYTPPLMTYYLQREGRNPFKVLISTILSLRTKDATTKDATDRLFERAQDAKGILKIPEEELTQLIYPVGFYKTKAKTIHKVCRLLIDEYNDVVPDEVDELLKLPGVGRKTANLVVALGYDKPALCVDIHVHRISNRLGYIKTKTPDETEFTLRKKLPQKYWIVYNDLLVAYGQNLCVPISPFCSKCPIASHCKRVGVDKSR